MKRTTVKLKDLKPNPYKEKIQGGFIEQTVVEQIKESALKTSFWEQWVARENSKGDYELAFGHHRLAAAIELYGSNYEVSVQVEPYTDAQMLIALADENTGSEESVAAQVDVIRLARSYLRNYPAACKQQVSDCRTPVQKHGHEQECQHGSVRCLLAFLGEVNWSKTKIADLVRIADHLDNVLLKNVVNWDDDPKRRGQVGVIAAVEISKLEKTAQKDVVAAITKGNRELQTFKEQEVKTRRERSQPSSAVREMTTHIPAYVVKQAVRKAADLPPTQQAQVAVEHIKQAVSNRKGKAINDSLPEADKVVSIVVSQLYDFPDRETIKELIGSRELLTAANGTRLLTAFNEHIERMKEHVDALLSPAQKKLSA
jgi:hypothetical protein